MPFWYNTLYIAWVSVGVQGIFPAWNFLHCHSAAARTSTYCLSMALYCSDWWGVSVATPVSYTCWIFLINWCVKIFIMVMFSNAMNPRETLPVLSLHKDAVPGLYARSHSASLGLPRSGQTRIISWPDYSGYQDLVRILWPMLHVSTVHRPSPQAVKPEPFASHFDWFGVHPPRPAPRSIKSL